MNLGEIATFLLWILASQLLLLLLLVVEDSSDCMFGVVVIPQNKWGPIRWYSTMDKNVNL